ncbi:glycosyltransferase family 4 protein [Paracoccus xiamenensis]|uniref:glycosyltransferase family 4 protein n=1 Tax=Paracoccus xiamenensis TaxID=2714901 RepID=UPI00140B003D|nr:glycosyltransferase family 4 protein [Paracoccus xiamenensis]NHF72006.1 glycosyltransferase family 4 protein [Paracoccus xiamenensis]
MTAPRPATFAIPGDIETLTGGYIYERRLLQGLREQGRDVQHMELPASFPAPSPAEMAQAVRRLQSVPADRVLILDGLVFGAIASAGLATVRAPILAMVHHPLAMETGLDPDQRAYLYRTERDNLRLARHVLVPSPHTRAVLIDRYGLSPERISIARPGVERPAAKAVPTQPPLILSVGILHPRKGHDVLIDSLTRIADLDWQAVIVGNAWHKQHAADLANMAAGSGLGPRLRLAGQVPAETLQRLYSQASIFALATRFEGYGIVFDEALSHGLPIVSCATGAVPDTVPAGAGILVPPDDSASFAAALRDLLENPDKRARLAAAASAVSGQLPSWSDTAQAAGLVLDGPEFA